MGLTLLSCQLSVSGGGFKIKNPFQFNETDFLFNPGRIADIFNLKTKTKN